MDHAPIKPAFGYRFDYEGCPVVVSGDTSHEGLEQAATDVDLVLTDALSHKLIHSLAKVAASAGAKNRAQILRDVLDYHADTRNPDGLAQRSNIRQIALYHLVPPTRNSLMEKIFTQDIQRCDRHSRRHAFLAGGRQRRHCCRVILLRCASPSPKITTPINTTSPKNSNEVAAKAVDCESETSLVAG